MSTITSLKLGVVPITEEGVDRYKFSDDIELHFTQIYATTEDLNCSVGRIFTKMKVPVSWFTVMNANYLIADMDINNPSGSSLHIKGWIDSMNLISDSEEYPQVEIRWHFDYYEMYKSSITLGYGHIKRRPFDALDNTPIQNYGTRYFKKGSTDVDLLSGDGGWVGAGGKKVYWAIITYNDSWTSGTSTSCETIFIPFFEDGAAVYIYWDVGQVYQTFSWNTIIRSLIDDRLGIPASAIVGAWISPMFPFNVPWNEAVSGTGTAADPFHIGTSRTWQRYKHGGHNADPSDPYEYVVFGQSASSTQLVPTKNQDLGVTKVSSEEERLVVVSWDGSKMLELPYGYAFRYYSSRLFVNANDAYIQISFSSSASPNALENMVGMTTNIPLPSLPINQNAWTDYVYSGQRDYDKEGRMLQTQADAVKGTVSGATTGALVGGFASMGAIAGAGLGATSALVNYGVESLWLNDKEQGLLDRLKANQLSALIISSNALQPFFDKLGIHLRSIVPDDYSATQLSNTRTNFGISVDEILASCDTTVRTTLPTGYYSIKNLIISGSVPKEAKDYIKKKFDAGVRLL